ncbi:ABC transporter ATP-binding protein [Nocardioides humi]|uniref:Dipeptide ABC transporter ATP-binding protein n=1 Tax=Nocardioides humi TaxID=449461 RepID=A0ABN2BS68_9ACTN|nr:oligopeptide/dipeptide ABC transporter ATP-binding protein [Nocardioides humi]
MTATREEENQVSAPEVVAPALVELEDLKVHFPITSGGLLRRQIGAVKAVDGVSFKIDRGETLGLVGESGSGKSTTGRAVLQLYRPTAGRVLFEGEDLARLKGKELRRMRRRSQMIFQDPSASLNPRMTVAEILGEPLHVHGLASGQAKVDRIHELLETVGLSRLVASRYPHEFSGGQRQRIGIARALAVEPQFIVADEPISALDVSVQAQVVNLLEDLQRRFNLAYLFVAHDLSVVRHLSDRVAVMYLGRIVEMADRDDFYRDPTHPYSQALLSAVPMPDPVAEATREQIILGGEIASPADPPSGCTFRTRCWKAQEVCVETQPLLVEVKPRHWSACHFPE